MKKNFIIAGLFIAGLYNAQQNGSVGINTKTPSGATLDVQIDKSTGYNKTLGQGVAVPRVTKQELSEMTGTIAEGALVYVNTIGTATGTATARVADVTTANGVGFYYFDKTKWVKVGGGASTAAPERTFSRNVRVFSTTPYNVVADDYMLINKNTGTGVINLPLSPEDGRTICGFNTNTLNDLQWLVTNTEHELVGQNVTYGGYGQCVIYSASDKKWYTTTAS